MFLGFDGTQLCPSTPVSSNWGGYPSTAATAVMGRSANGWLEWKSPQGRTLDEVKRQSVTVAD
ncbi:DUF4357 domain-containing protein [Polaromonas sp. UBA4122]|uniref:DUF4357 domain-containing protein n=1 Tax=Polaromonas sp. UBA4122 TaxID=1947074 RepID=UPI0032E39F1C